MIIIYEGADGVGKTTAVSLTIEQLHEEGGAHVLHRGPPMKHPLVEYTADLEWLQREHAARHVVCDRWHWGELIYGPIFRGGTSFTSAAWAAVNEYLASVGAIICFIDDQESVVRKRLEDRGDDEHVLEHLGDILMKYRDLYEAHRVGTGPRCTRIEGLPSADHIARVISEARRAHAAAH